MLLQSQWIKVKRFRSNQVVTTILFLMCALRLESVIGQKIMPHDDLKFSFEIEEALATDNISSSRAAYFFTYLGEYQRALETYELMLRWGLDTLRLDPNKVELRSAISYLKDFLKNEQLIIVSEAHHKPQHRLFTRQLVEALAPLGFNHLGLEALTNFPGYRDSLINERGYALKTPPSGVYTREPAMADLIRTASQRGYQIFGFDKDEMDIERDTQMALNIIEYLDQHPQEKVIIHTGWHHAVESAFPKRKNQKWMAYLIKQLSDYNPVTIYQDVFSEKILRKELDLYNRLHSEEISVVLDRDGRPFRFPQQADHFDIHICHPRTKYNEGRPEWIFKKDHFKYDVQEQDSDLTYPIICRAMLANEYPNGVPYDIIEIRHRYINKPLVLSQGNFVLEIIDKNRDKQIFEIQIP